MKAALYTQGQGFAVVDRPVPSFGPGDLLLRVEASSICGTDIKIVRSGHRKLRDGQAIILGHEFVGVIEAAGPDVSGFAPGDRVGVAPNIGRGSCPLCDIGCGAGRYNMCPNYSAYGIDRDGAHAAYVAIEAASLQQRSVFRLPEGMDAPTAALAEPLSCVLNGLEACRLAPGDRVLIYGAGPMGMLHVMAAAALGASAVYLADIQPARLAQGATFGATATVNSARDNVPDWVRQQTSGRGLDVVIVAAPVPALCREGLELLAPYGRLLLFAGFPRGAEAAVPLDANLIHYRNLYVTGNTGGAPAQYRQALELIHARRIPVEKVISHRFALDQLDAAYAVALAGQGLKIVLQQNPPPA